MQDEERRRNMKLENGDKRSKTNVSRRSLIGGGTEAQPGLEAPCE